MHTEKSLNKLRHNRCINCAYFFRYRRTVERTIREEIKNQERLKLLNNEGEPEDKTYQCLFDWLFTDVTTNRCSAGQWERHKEGVHPETAERKRKERKESRRWAIGIGLSVIILVLTVVSLFQNCASSPNS